MDLVSKYVMRDNNKENIFHSSAYGKAQSGGALGAASTDSFKNRMKLERNRQIVKGYGASSIANNALGNGPRAKEYVPPKQSGINSRMSK